MCRCSAPIRSPITCRCWKRPVSDVEAYEETPGWRERVNAAFNAVVDASDTLTAEMGEAAAAAVVAEAMLTVQIQPYPRRVLVVARRPD